MIEKAYEMIEEARSNPNWLAEKQAELKKMGKKGKKWADRIFYFI